MIITREDFINVSALPDCCHCDNRPPKTKWNGQELIVGIVCEPLAVVDERGEDDNAEDEEEYEKHEFFGGGPKKRFAFERVFTTSRKRLKVLLLCRTALPECVHEDLETARVLCELEETEYTDDSEKLQVSFHLQNISKCLHKIQDV